MKRQTMKSLVASLAVAVCVIPAGVNAGPTASAKGTDCHSIAAGLRKAVAANPSQVLIYVEDSMIANGACACEIVKAAILGAGANTGKADANALVKQIVYTAITTNPTMASVIVECAMAVAPGAAAEIQAALKEALGDGKGDGGGIAAGPGVRGIYLVPPVASGAVLLQETVEVDQQAARRVVEEVEIRTAVEREVIRRPIRPLPPVSPSSAP